jgi:hypothetical protein
MTPLHALALATTLVGGVLLTAQVHDERPGNSSTRTLPWQNRRDLVARSLREITIPEGTVLPIALDSSSPRHQPRGRCCPRARAAPHCRSGRHGHSAGAAHRLRHGVRGPVASKVAVRSPSDSAGSLPAPNERLTIRTSAVASPPQARRDVTKIAVGCRRRHRRRDCRRQERSGCRSVAGVVPERRSSCQPQSRSQARTRRRGLVSCFSRRRSE